MLSKTKPPMNGSYLFTSQTASTLSCTTVYFLLIESEIDVRGWSRRTSSNLREYCDIRNQHKSCVETRQISTCLVEYSWVRNHSVLMRVTFDHDGNFVTIAREGLER